MPPPVVIERLSVVARANGTYPISGTFLPRWPRVPRWPQLHRVAMGDGVGLLLVCSAGGRELGM